jgi:hypothetical protein
MKIRHWLMWVCLSDVLVSPLFAAEPKAVVANSAKPEVAFVKMMRGFVEAEDLSGIFQPTHVCQNGKEVCGRVKGNLVEILRKRPDFVLDTNNFQKVHPGATCSYRGRSGSSHYSLHIVCYGKEEAGVHMDVRLPEGTWGKFEHDVRDVAENYFKIHALRMKGSHTSDMKLARSFNLWWQSYQSAYPETASLEIPTEAEELLSSQKRTLHRSTYQSYARALR